ncbi:hypothetical protein [Parasphingopyxis marina]|uniref:Hpt domain-containing protein n=1 Tax=Parasphingopyxis marina TaxID=2761622 RepID=A0A842I2F8_9SPHN|nr:hypothetical protein [Parasphingopyxis marina]MBC2778909.1 hypothetical protein [Parasphingopyxis marina]
MDLDDIMEVTAVDRATLKMLAERLRGSSSFEHFIYREAELDEAWRLIDLALATPDSGGDRKRLEDLRLAIAEAHDLVGVDHRPLAAAVRLEEAILADLAEPEGKTA